MVIFRTFRGDFGRFYRTCDGVAVTGVKKRMGDGMLCFIRFACRHVTSHTTKVTLSVFLNNKKFSY